jgi:hypothetical protein
MVRYLVALIVVGNIVSTACCSPAARAPRRRQSGRSDKDRTLWAISCGLASQRWLVHPVAMPGVPQGLGRWWENHPTRQKHYHLVNKAISQP